MANWYKDTLRAMEDAWKSFEDIKYCWFSNFEEYQTRIQPDYFIMNENTQESVEKLKKWLMHFEYDSWWGWQEFFWEVVFNDGTWLERWEYDGSEWREYKKTPERPDFNKFREAEKKYRYEHTHSVLDED